MATEQKQRSSLGLNNPNQKSDKKQSLPFHTAQMEAIMKMKQKYQRNVQQPVQVIQNIAFNKMPQKCLTHNNNYTLYCETDQKPMCASCVYQNQTHKNHRVVPLTSCSGQLKRDCEKLQRQLTSIVIDLTGLVKHLNQGISKLQKQFPHLVWKIEDGYKSLHQFLVDKEKQHVNQLRYYKQKIKYQHGALSAQLNKIAMYTQQKIQVYQRKVQLDMLLTKRNVFQALKGTSKIIAQQLNIKQQNQPKVHFQVFAQIQEFIYAKLPKLFSKQNKKNQSNLHNIRNSRKQLNSKSKQKSSVSPMTKKVQNNVPPKSPLKSHLTPTGKQKQELSSKKNSNKSLIKHQKEQERSIRIPSKTPPKITLKNQNQQKSRASPMRQSQQRQAPPKHSRSNSKSSSPKKK